MRRCFHFVVFSTFLRPLLFLLKWDPHFIMSIFGVISDPHYIISMVCIVFHVFIFCLIHRYWLGESTVCQMAKVRMNSLYAIWRKNTTVSDVFIFWGSKSIKLMNFCQAYSNNLFYLLVNFVQQNIFGLLASLAIQLDHQ